MGDVISVKSPRSNVSHVATSKKMTGQETNKRANRRCWNDFGEKAKGTSTVVAKKTRAGSDQLCSLGGNLFVRLIQFVIFGAYN